MENETLCNLVNGLLQDVTSIADETSKLQATLSAANSQDGDALLSALSDAVYALDGIKMSARYTREHANDTLVAACVEFGNLELLQPDAGRLHRYLRLIQHEPRLVTG